MGTVVSSTVANMSTEQIWIKYDFQDKNVIMEKFTREGKLGFEGATVEGGDNVEKVYDLKKNEMQFTPVLGGKVKRFDIRASCNDIVYLSIITDKGEIICNAIPKKIDRNIVIMEGLQVRNGVKDLKRPFDITDPIAFVFPEEK